MSRALKLETLKMRLNNANIRHRGLSQYIARTLRSLILDGTLTAGIKLPATRELAKALNVSRDTIENAYIQLHRDGFIVRKMGSGSYISEQIGPRLQGTLHAADKHKEKKRYPTKPENGLSKRGQMIFTRQGITDQQTIQAFATGLPETRTFPTDIWERLQRQVLKDCRTDMLLHGDPQGAEPLRQAVASYLNLERGAKVSPEHILILSSTRQALYLCAQLLEDANGSILMENPGYFGARKAFEAAENRIIPIDVDEQGLLTDQLPTDRNNARCIYVTPSHQYPTGATLSLARRLELIQWAADNGKWIIEDDYDSEFHYDGLPTTCVQGLDTARRTLYLGTFSKTLYPGLRIGYAALPPELVRTFVYARSIIDGHTPQILQLTLARFMENGHYNTHIRNMRKLYAARRQIMFQAIEHYLKGIVTALHPPGGLQIPCLLEEGWSEEKTIRQAAAAGITLPGLSRLYAGEHKKQGWLLGYAALTAHEIEYTMQRLSTVLKRK